MERWDAYYADGSPAQRTLLRGEPIPEGLYHLVAEVLVRHSDGTFLLMRRDPEKDFCPGMWEASAGGSALVGECAEEAACREVREETGLPVCALQKLYHERGDAYLFDYFLGQTDADKASVQLQPGETVDYRWVSLAQLREAVAAGSLMHARMLAEFITKIEA